MSEVRESVTCEVCSEKYSSGKREPLFLPCGHTFCRYCLTNIKNTGNFVCPSCRQLYNHLFVEQLPVNYSLLKILDSYVDFELDSCKEHGDDLKYWCYECKLPLCSLCLYSGHPAGHKVQLGKYFLQEKKHELEDQAESIFEMIKQQQNQARNSFRQVYENIFYLLNSRSDLVGLVRQVQEASSIGIIFELDKCITKMQAEFRACKTETLTEEKPSKQEEEEIEEKNMVSEKKSEETAAENVAKKKTETENTKKETEIEVSKKETETEVSKKKTEMKNTETAQEEETESVCGAAAAVKFDEMRSLLDCCSGNILLRSLQFPDQPDPSSQVEVFLELSVDDQCLGRVFLRLWTHLRRARHFLVVCLGSYGYTFMGASASAVCNKDSPKEGLVFYDCVKDNAEVTDYGLINSLEWGGQYQGDIREGIVAGSISRQRQYHTSSFVITTVSQAGAKYECPFGEVTAGLEVVKEAVTIDPVSDVYISKCGLVLPDVAL